MSHNNHISHKGIIKFIYIVIGFTQNMGPIKYEQSSARKIGSPDAQGFGILSSG